MTNFTSNTLIAFPLRYNEVTGGPCDALAREELRENFIT